MAVAGDGDRTRAGQRSAGGVPKTTRADPKAIGNPRIEIGAPDEAAGDYCRVTAGGGEGTRHDHRTGHERAAAPERGRFARFRSSSACDAC